MGGNPQLFHCGSSERWQSPECEYRCDIAEIERELSEAWHLLNVLSLNMMDDGPTWPRVLEWLRRNEQYRPANDQVMAPPIDDTKNL